MPKANARAGFQIGAPPFFFALEISTLGFAPVTQNPKQKN
jgi:hypothetical protein